MHTEFYLSTGDAIEYKLRLKRSNICTIKLQYVGGWGRDPPDDLAGGSWRSYASYSSSATCSPTCVRAGGQWPAGYAEEVAAVPTADWIRHEFKLGFQAAADLVRVGLEMDSLPASVAAVQDAAIGFQHLVFMARTKAAVGSRPFDEEHLLAEAREVSVGRFWHLCQQARHAADAAGVARELAVAVEARALRINRQQDGMVTISGLLDPIGGTALKAALEPLARKGRRR